MGLSVILWCSVIWLPVLMCFMLRNEARFKKNIVVGVTFPKEGREDSEVTRVLSKFKRGMALICIGLVIAAVPCMFIGRFEVQYTVWLIWIDFVIVLPYVYYGVCNKKLKEIKRKRGWLRQSDSVAEIKVAAVPVKWLSPWLFILPFALSLIPVIFDSDMWIMYVIDAVMMLLCWFGYRYLYRNKAEAVDDNVEITEMLTRVRRYNWGKCWLWCAWFLAALNAGIWLLQDFVWPLMAVIFIITCALCTAVISVEFKTRKVQEKLTKDSGAEYYVDEDDKWILGIFYYDKNDSHLIVNNRIGMNSTCNLARPAGKVMIAFLAAMLIAMPLIGVYLMKAEETPVTVRMDASSVEAVHMGTHYIVELEDIVDVQLLEQKPEIKRVVGTDMDSVQKGQYRGDIGRVTACFDPRVGPYILITTKDNGLYLFGGSDGKTGEVYAEIIEAVKYLIE